MIVHSSAASGPWAVARGPGSASKAVVRLMLLAVDSGQTVPSTLALTSDSGMVPSVISRWERESRETERLSPIRNSRPAGTLALNALAPSSSALWRR